MSFLSRKDSQRAPKAVLAKQQIVLLLLLFLRPPVRQAVAVTDIFDPNEITYLCKLRLSL